MQKAVFLDRDGVLNREVNYLRNIKQLRLLPKTSLAIKKLNDASYLTIVIANQAVVARGWISEKKLEEINAELSKRIKKGGAKIDAIYYCPHHPNADTILYRKDCKDRKPNIGLVKKAVKRFNISLKESFFVGDQTRDIQTAKNAHIKSILVKTGYKGEDDAFKVTPDFTAKDLYAAVSNIILASL